MPAQAARRLEPPVPPDPPVQLAATPVAGKRALVFLRDDSAAEPVLSFLQENGLACSVVRRPERAIEACRRDRVDLVVLEAPASVAEGLWLCRALSSLTAAPLLIVSVSSNPLDRVAYLDFLADDYVETTCHPLELLARARAVMRRGRTAELGRDSKGSVAFAGCEFDPTTGGLYSPQRELYWLSRSETELLELFVRHPRQVLDRREIRDRLFGSEAPQSLRAVDMRVRRLRRSLGRASETAGKIIRTSYRTGYMFACEVTPAA